MQKVVIIILIVFLVLVACEGNLDGTASQRTSNYHVSIISGTEDNVFKSDFEFLQPEITSIEEVNKPLIATLQIGKQKVSAAKTRTIHRSFSSSVDVFCSEDNNTEYRTYRMHNSFRVFSKNDTILCPYNNTEISENALKDFVMEYVQSFVDVDNWDTYKYNCFTSIVVSKPDATWRDEKDHFYIARSTDGHEEEVLSYRFEFIKYCQGFETADRIVVECSCTGHITDISYINYGVDWSSFILDEQQIQSSISNCLQDAISESYVFSDHMIQSEILVYRNGQICLSVVCELVLKKDGAEMGVLCPLIVSSI